MRLRATVVLDSTHGQARELRALATEGLEDRWAREDRREDRETRMATRAMQKLEDALELAFDVEYVNRATPRTGSFVCDTCHDQLPSDVQRLRESVARGGATDSMPCGKVMPSTAAPCKGTLRKVK